MPQDEGAFTTRQPTRIEVYAKVIRADGTIQDEGLVAAQYTWRKPLKKLVWPFRKRLADRRIARFNKNNGKV